MRGPKFVSSSGCEESRLTLAKYSRRSSHAQPPMARHFLAHLRLQHHSRSYPVDLSTAPSTGLERTNRLSFTCSFPRNTTRTSLTVIQLANVVPVHYLKGNTATSTVLSSKYSVGRDNVGVCVIPALFSLTILERRHSAADVLVILTTPTAM